MHKVVNRETKGPSGCALGEAEQCCADDVPLGNLCSRRSAAVWWAWLYGMKVLQLITDRSRRRSYLGCIEGLDSLGRIASLS